MTTETKFTPGPWYVREIDLHYGGKGVEVVDGDGEVICDNRTYYPQAINPKNAALIAAAPDLLEALQKMVKMASSGMVDFNPHDEFVMSSARAALAKARGES